MTGQHHVVVAGKWRRVPGFVRRAYNKYAYRLLGYSASSTRYRK